MTEHRELYLRKAARGYIITTSPRGPEVGIEYAFDKIEDLAEWLVKTYNPPRSTTTFMGKSLKELTDEERQKYFDYIKGPRP